METEQLNVEVAVSIAKDAKRDCLECATSLKAYVSEALRHFKQLPVAERRLRFASKGSRKLTGRPVSA